MHPMTGSARLPRIPVRFLVVAALHGGLYLAINDALQFSASQDLQPPLTARVLPAPPVKPDPWIEPPEPPDLEHSFVDPLPVPVPDLDDLSPDPAAGDSGAITSSNDGVGFTAQPSILPVRPHADHPPTQPVYPPASIRFGEEGVVELEILVLRDGRIAQVRVVHGSGYPRLDRAAVEEARERWRLQPAQRGGVHRDEWGHFRVVFRIANR
jgi:periplasmic protein TonB